MKSSLIKSNHSYRPALLILLVMVVSAPGLWVMVRGLVDFSLPWWQHLTGTILPVYLANTMVVAVGATTMALVLGGIPAWLTFRYAFAGRGWCVFLQILPLIMPAYVSAGLFLEASSAPFWESRSALLLELAAGASPFVFLFLRLALNRLPAAMFEAAASLGAGPLVRAWRVGLPLISSPLIAAASLVAAEAVSDFGAAHRVGIATFSVGLHQQWFALQSPRIATMLALMLFLFAAFLAVPIIRFGLGSQRAEAIATLRPLTPRQVSVAGAACIHIACLLAVVPGFLAPFMLVLRWTVQYIDRINLSTMFQDAGSTLLTSLITVLACLVLTLMFIFALETGERTSTPDRGVWLVAVNWVTPSLVLATFWLALGVSGRAVIVIATTVKLLPILLLPVADRLARLPAALVESALALGCSRLAAVRRVVLPQLATTLAGGLLLVFIMAAAELTLALALQPFAYNAISLRVHASANLFLTRSASVWVLCLVLICLYPTWRLSLLTEHSVINRPIT